MKGIDRPSIDPIETDVSFATQHEEFSNSFDVNLRSENRSILYPATRKEDKPLSGNDLELRPARLERATLGLEGGRSTYIGDLASV